MHDYMARASLSPPRAHTQSMSLSAVCTEATPVAQPEPQTREGVMEGKARCA